MTEILSLPTTDVNWKDDDRSTALGKAVIRDSIDIVQLLLDNGADPNSTNNNNRTPLHSAVFINPNKEFIELLLQYGANPNIEDIDGETPIDLVRKLLSEYKAAQTIQNNEGETSKDLAQEYIDIEKLFNPFILNRHHQSCPSCSIQGGYKRSK